MHRDRTFIRGYVTIRLLRPRSNLLATGPRLITVHHERGPNLVTAKGDQYYGDAGAALHANLTVTAPTAVKGMQLGSGSTAAAKTGAGAAIVTYISGSNIAIDAGFPTSTQPGSARRITWQTTFLPGVATATINEAVLVNPTSFTDSAAAEADTLSRYVLAASVVKTGTDTLIATWDHDLLGA